MVEGRRRVTRPGRDAAGVESKQSTGGWRITGGETETGHRLPVEKGDLVREQQAAARLFLVLAVAAIIFGLPLAATWTLPGREIQCDRVESEAKSLATSAKTTHERDRQIVDFLVTSLKTNSLRRSREFYVSCRCCSLNNTDAFVVTHTDREMLSLRKQIVVNIACNWPSWVVQKIFTWFEGLNGCCNIFKMDFEKTVLNGRRYFFTYSEISSN